MTLPTASESAVASPAALANVTTTLSLDANISEVCLHLGVTNYGYTITRDLRANTLSLVVTTK